MVCFLCDSQWFPPLSKPTSMRITTVLLIFFILSTSIKAAPFPHETKPSEKWKMHTTTFNSYWNSGKQLLPNLVLIDKKSIQKKTPAFWNASFVREFLLKVLKYPIQSLLIIFTIFFARRTITFSKRLLSRSIRRIFIRRAKQLR